MHLRLQLHPASGFQGIKRTTDSGESVVLFCVQAAITKPSRPHIVVTGKIQKLEQEIDEIAYTAP